jgi:2-keto-4-pentenoate hydratase/2-oxohepta-3-ene-1,7-dioic acid hydratase in catechol pathway
MRLLRVGESGSEKVAVMIDDDRAFILDVEDHSSALIRSEIAAAGKQALSGEVSALEIPLAGVRIAPPIRPGKIVCVGLNYRRHAAEAKLPVPDEPILFLKASDTLSGPNDEVVIPLRSTKTDYEVELGVVIGRSARNLTSPSAAMDAVAGYLVANDVSEREFQLDRGGQWDKGKNAETFSPIGPFLVTSDEITDPQSLRLTTRVNGQLRQDSSTADMIFPVDFLVWYISQFMTLYAGDLILTGTPEGVGSGYDPPRFLRDGDVVELEISGLGSQQQHFVSARSAAAERRLVPVGAKL